MDKLVSIIMPSFNSAEFIGETIDSVVNQTYTNWEIIIIDDCSSDNTKEIVECYQEKDNRIKFLQLKENSGAAVARQYGIDNASGDYIAFLDSDDLWLADKLSKQINFMKENNYACTCTSYEKFKDNISKKIVAPPLKTSYKMMLLNDLVGNSTVIINKELVGEIKIPNIKKRNDVALWLYLLKKIDYIYGFREVLMKYRIREDSLSGNKLNLIKYHWILYRNIEKLGIIKSVYLILNWAVVKTISKIIK